MGIAERKGREKVELRAKILEAAKELFVTEGYDKTSLRNIAEKVEYSPATIYLYFKDKVEILHEVCLSGFCVLFEVFEETIHEQDPLKRLLLMGQKYVEFALKNPEMYDLMFILNEPMMALKEEDGWKEGFKTFYFLRDTISEAMLRGQIRAANPEITAVSLWASVHGLASLYIRNRFKMFPQEQRDIILRLAIQQVIDNFAACPQS